MTAVETIDIHDEASLCAAMESLGALRTGVVDVKDIVFEPAFRELCASNACGNFGRCWMCPPHVGDIHTLIAQAKKFNRAIVYQTVGELEDSYDFEGMMDAAAEHNKVSRKITEAFQKLPFEQALHLGAGGCHVCESCAKKEELPCRFPELAIAGLETYGIAVSQLAEIAQMKYINGENTVTYFGAYFY